MTMKTICTLALCAAFAHSPTGVSAQAKPKDPKAVMKTAERIFNEKFGGRLTKPGTGTGCTGFINVGSAVDRAEIDRVVATIGSMLKHEQKVFAQDTLHGLPTREMVAKLGIAVGVFVVADKTLPPMLIAPEERWALVNVAKLKEGLAADAAGNALYRVRVRGELQRAFCYVAGSGSSQYKDNLMNVTELPQLDTSNPETMVFDAATRCRQYLSTVGVTHPVLVSYQKACQQGWAPKPTNDVQKAIWDKVHAIPTKPIKIEFDPKTDTK